jgi:hypothetical protein
MIAEKLEGSDLCTCRSPVFFGFTAIMMGWSKNVSSHNFIQKQSLSKQSKGAAVSLPVFSTMIMMTKLAFRAPILAFAASLFLALNGRVVMAQVRTNFEGGRPAPGSATNHPPCISHPGLFRYDCCSSTCQFDTGSVRTSVVTTNSGNTLMRVIFYHDDVLSADPDNTYSVSYYYAGCVNQLPSTGMGIEAITDEGGTTNNPSNNVDPVINVNTCGPNNITPCAKKTAYSFIVQRLADITHPDVFSTTGTKTTVKFCVRHSLNADGPVERGYREADVTVEWTTNGDFSNTISTSEEGPATPDVDVGDVSVAVQRCSNNGKNLANPYEQGELIQLCLSASVTVNTAQVTIVKVDNLRYWIDNNLQGVNGVYNDGETTQLGMANGSPVGTTTITPANAGTGTTYCTQAFGAYNGAMAGSGCVIGTFLGPDFYIGDNTVVFAGSVTIEFGNGNNNNNIRRLQFRGRALRLQLGDQFDKTYASTINTLAAGDSRDDDCNCSGFILFKIICWFIKCMLGFK